MILDRWRILKGDLQKKPLWSGHNCYRPLDYLSFIGFCPRWEFSPKLCSTDKSIKVIIIITTTTTITIITIIFNIIIIIINIMVVVVKKNRPLLRKLTWSSRSGNKYNLHETSVTVLHKLARFNVARSVISPYEKNRCFLLEII